jgi:hypothetical protein
LISSPAAKKHERKRRVDPLATSQEENEKDERTRGVKIMCEICEINDFSPFFSPLFACLESRESTSSSAAGGFSSCLLLEGEILDALSVNLKFKI